jgi:hypothetical protein
MLVRYNSNGSIDTSFGMADLFAYDGGNGDRGFRARASQDGKSLTVGYIYAPGGHRDVLGLRNTTRRNTRYLIRHRGCWPLIVSSSGTDIGFGVVSKRREESLWWGKQLTKATRRLVIRLTPAGSLDSQFWKQGGVFTYGHTKMKMDRAFAAAIGRRKDHRSGGRVGEQQG